MKNIAILSVFALALSGCGGSGSGVGMSESPLWHMTASADQKLEYFKQQCRGFGFKDNTPEMAQCIQNQTNQSRSNASAKMDRFARQQQQLNRQNRIRTTNCNQWGRQINCTTY
jgi:hypothetical protein